jgi:hypothetical protein
MAATSFFNIVLKVLGIYFIRDIVISIPTLFSVFYSFGRGDVGEAFSTLLVLLLTLFIYCLVAYYLIFKTDWLIQKMQLLKNVPEDPIPLQIHRSTVISISLLVVAFYLIAQAIPQLVRGFTKWYQYNRIMGGFPNALDPFDYSTILVFAAEIIVGLLLIGYQRQLVNFIELKTRKLNQPR